MSWFSLSETEGLSSVKLSFLAMGTGGLSLAGDLLLARLERIFYYLSLLEKRAMVDFLYKVFCCFLAGFASFAAFSVRLVLLQSINVLLLSFNY